MVKSESLSPKSLLEQRLHRLRRRRQAKSAKRRAPVVTRARPRRRTARTIATMPVTTRFLAIPQASRVFDEDRYGSSAIEDYSSGLRRLETDPASLVVATGGACVNNGYPGARAGYGVFFSALTPDLNCSGLVPHSSPQTSQFAELYATMQALDKVHQLIIAGEDLSHVVLKTDSAYLQQGLSEFIWKWLRNGFRNWRGQPILNGRAFRYLHEKVALLERDYGIRVSFCLVDRVLNERADGLAKDALSWVEDERLVQSREKAEQRTERRAEQSAEQKIDLLDW